ncbi:MAG: AAA family ATPase [Actinobacteria bacterium]|uniref:PhoH-like protein n=2 Tax=freshwater metagenome TaxID=449393 RepID=A0A6J6HU04_9ZZZZ|nr:AAA family ATPase [Actinomycetota bacterium]
MPASKKENVSDQFELAVTDLASVFGPGDQLVRELESIFAELRISARGNKIKLEGSAVAVSTSRRAIDELATMVANGRIPTAEDVNRVVAMLKTNLGAKAAEVLSQSILSSRGKTIRPKTEGQKTYVDAIDQHTIVFGIGPAGTGKTYLAMAKAVQALQRKEVSRIILTRPAVEAGERLGFLPGTLNDKIDPYLRPLFDALGEMLDADAVPKLMAAGTIEVAPLAYMRGRTLNDCFVILDEAQNTTPEQMKMFLTRLGFNSKMVITGDITQVDLPAGVSGLKTAEAVLQNIDDMYFATLTSADVVRHSLVARIVDAYTKFEQKNLVNASRSKR